MVLGAHAPQAPGAPAAHSAALRGTRSGLFPTGTPFTGSPARVHVAAKTVNDGTGRGRLRILHRHPDGTIEANPEGQVTCLMVDERRPRLTGTVTDGMVRVAPGFDHAGQRVAITIDDLAADDRAGLDLAFLGTPHATRPARQSRLPSRLIGAPSPPTSRRPAGRHPAARVRRSLACGALRSEGTARR